MSVGVGLTGIGVGVWVDAGGTVGTWVGGSVGTIEGTTKDTNVGVGSLSSPQATSKTIKTIKKAQRFIVSYLAKIRSPGYYTLLHQLDQSRPPFYNELDTDQFLAVSGS
jgi:hypothetical protein